MVDALPEASLVPFKVQIFEPFAGWHHTKYIAMLLPSLLRLKEAGRVSDIILTTSKTHCESEYFRDLVSPYLDGITVDERNVDHHGLKGVAVSRLLLESVRSNKPNYIISTSANNGLLALGVASLFGVGLPSQTTTSVGVIHNGYVGRVRGTPHRFRNAVQRIGRSLSPWTEMHVVNPLLFETIKSYRRDGSRTIKLLPDPVPVPPPLSSVEARSMLGIPTDGRYIGFIGKSDPRKAMPELLSAFRAAGLGSNDRLLIAGSVYPPYKSLLVERYGDLIDSRRIIVLDRYLTNAELSTALSAIDVSAIAYYTDELSGNLLSAIASGTPVLASPHGYSGMIVRQFDVGWVADFRDPEAYTRELRGALDKSRSYSLSEKARRLLAFHDPQNYADCLLQPLYRLLNVSNRPVKSWNWAVTGIDDAEGDGE